RQSAGGYANPPSSAVGHHGLRATTMSTTVPGAAKVPAAGFCPTTVPGFASLVRRRVTVPSVRPSSSSRVRASACDRPSRSATAIVGAPRLTTTVTGAPGLSTEVAAGRVSIATPVLQLETGLPELVRRLLQRQAQHARHHAVSVQQRRGEQEQVRRQVTAEQGAEQRESPAACTEPVERRELPFPDRRDMPSE